MLRVCICDSAEERRLLKKETLCAYFAEKDAQCEILLFESAEKLIISDTIAQTDIFVIDSCLGDTDGIHSVRELKESYRNKVYILTSDSYDYLDEAMDLGVIRYILNSAAKEQYYSAMDKALEDINFFIVHIKGRNGNEYYLHKNEIVYVEAKARRLFILTTNGRIEANMSIAQMRELLNTPNFINPHYSFVVNSDYISHIAGKDIFVKVKYHYFRVPIATKRYALTKKQLANV